MDFARRHDIPVPVTAERPYSTDRNLFHISYRAASSRPLGEPRQDVPALELPRGGARRALEILVDFEDGDPVGVDGDRLGPAAPPDRSITWAASTGSVGGPGREPLRGMKFARCLRDSGDHPARGAARARIAQLDAKCCTCATR